MAATLASEGFDQAKMLFSLKYVTDYCDLLLNNESDLLKLASAFDSTSMDEITTKLVHLTCGLNTIRNRQISSISRLPLEIMGMIFKAFIPATDLLSAIDIEPTLTDGITSWCNASLVCRSWRDAALSTVSAWSMILTAPSAKYRHSNYGSGGSSMLTWRRFQEPAPKTALCTINDTSVMSAVQTTIGFYSKQLQRLRVDFGCISPMDGSQDSMLSSLCGTNLQVLVLQRRSEAYDHEYPPEVFCSTFLRGSQSLQVFILRGSPLESTARLPSTLRILCLSIGAFKNNSALNRFCQSLASLIALEELAIKFTSYYQSRDSPRTNEPGREIVEASMFSLPSLKRMVLDNQHEDLIVENRGRHTKSAIGLLNRIHLSPTCPLYFHTGSLDMCRSPVVKFRFVQAECIGLAGDRMIAVCGNSACCAKTALEYGSPQIDFECPGVRELWVAEGGKESMWKYFPNVERLALMANTSKYATAHAMEWQHIKSIFPILKKIRVLVKPSAIPIQGLLSLLKTRKDSGSPIESLQFVVCRGSSGADDIDAVRRKYGEICAKWRGVVGSLSYEIVDELPKMKVPPACSRLADVHTAWNPKLWDSNVTHTLDKQF